MINLLTCVVTQGLEFLKTPPLSTIFLLVLAFVVSTITTYISVRSMDLDAYRRAMIESSRAQQEVMAAMKSGNQRQIQRAQNRQREAQQAQMKFSSNTMKTSMYTMIPLLIMWSVLGTFYGRTIEVATMPFNPILFGTKLNYISWYLICSFTASIITRRVFGLSFEIDPKS